MDFFSSNLYRSYTWFGHVLTRIWDPISEKDAGAHVHRRPRVSIPSPKPTQKSPIGRTCTVYAHARRRPSRACKTSTYTVSGASFGTHAACGHYTARHVARTPRVDIYRLRRVMWHARRVWTCTISGASCGTHAACGHVPSQSRHVARTGASRGTHAACGYIPSQSRHVVRTPHVDIYRLSRVM